MTGHAMELMRLPIPSTEMDEVTLLHARGALSLRLEYGEREGSTGQFRFERARAHRHRAESHCPAWTVGAYDRLVEIDESPWLQELVAAMPEDMRDLFEMHHYAIYLDSFGCYEVVASAWSFAPQAERNGGGVGHADR
jgi:hypothetical protein